MKNLDTKEIMKNIRSFLKETLDTVLFVLIAVIVIRFFIGELRWIPSGSMHPTLVEGDRLFVEKLTRPVRDFQRGDILVFYPPDEILKKDFFSTLSRLTGILCRDIAFIKRIVGLPGDKLEIKNENGIYFVYINGEKLDEPYILSKTDWMPCRDDMYCGPFVVPENNFFMMGDNRGNSQDSRFWGFLPKNRIIGRAVFVFWPIGRAQKL